MIIREANINDLEAINNIYNQVIPSGISTADMIPYTIEERKKWFEAYDREKYPVYIAVIEKLIAGYIHLNPYRPRRLAMRYTAEVSYFIHKDYRNKGIGSELMKYILEEARARGFRTLIAILLAHNESSIGLLKKFNFEEWGRMPAIADFDGTERDHLYYGLRIG